MESSVATSTVLYRNSPIYVTFNELPLFYENPVSSQSNVWNKGFYTVFSFYINPSRFINCK
jgi:hypothetical protein